VRNLYRGFGTAAAGNVVGEILYLVTVETARYRLAGGWGGGGGGVKLNTPTFANCKIG